MVLDYYKLREHPFGVTPDSRYLFLSPTHGKRLAPFSRYVLQALDDAVHNVFGRFVNCILA
jgi:hypothetical protein